MITNLKTGGLDCLCCGEPGSRQVAYILYPMQTLRDWVPEAARKYGTSIVVITGMDWDNVFSPWPSPGQPPGSPDFKGESDLFLKTLQSVIPGIESELGIEPQVKRTLVGVSMSGLFALWQWMVCDTFTDIASLSGSFWFPGFSDWMKNHLRKGITGRGYFLLGTQESKSPVKAFDSVATDTAQIIDILKGDGVDVEFQWVPGNHFFDPIGRLNKAFSALFL